MKKNCLNDCAIALYGDLDYSAQKAVRADIRENGLEWELVELKASQIRLRESGGYFPMARIGSDRHFYEVDGYVVDENGKKIDDLKLIAFENDEKRYIRLDYCAVREDVLRANCYLEIDGEALVDLNGYKGGRI